jgi:hypothetical protein
VIDRVAARKVAVAAEVVNGPPARADVVVMADAQKGEQELAA